MPMPLRLTVNDTPVEIDDQAADAARRTAARPARWTGTTSAATPGGVARAPVLLDGQAVKSCSVPRRPGPRPPPVRTVEGLAAGDGSLHPVQEAFIACHGLQRGFGTAGDDDERGVPAERAPAAERGRDRARARGNLCRCTGYVNIVAAVRQAAQAMAGGRS